MVLDHEIPRGSKLHFGASAKLKREIESLVSSFLYRCGFEEISSPVFVYQEHQRSFLDRDVIKLSSENNSQIVMRSDSTVDVIRIVTRRLGRNTSHRKWFYVQPVFSYPTNELNQIGIEWLDDFLVTDVLNMCTKIFDSVGLSPTLQIMDSRVPVLCASASGLDISLFENMSVHELQKCTFVDDLIKVSSAESLRGFISRSPSFLKSVLEQLLDAVDGCQHKSVIFSPLLLPPVDYYKGLFFRMFIGNHTFLSGGVCTIDEIESCGFGIYTDNVIHALLDGENKGLLWQM